MLLKRWFTALNWKSLVPLSGCLTAAVLATAAVLPFLSLPVLSRPQTHEGPYSFQLQVASDTPGTAQLFYNIGRGYNYADSATVTLAGGGAAVPCSFALPLAGLRALRFDPNNGPGRFVLSHARIVDAAGTIVHEFPPESFQPAHHIMGWTISDQALTVTTVALANDPILEVRLPSHLKRRASFISALPRFSLEWVTVFVGVIALAAVVRRWLTASIRRLGAALQRRPVATLALLAGAAVVLQCHPLIFFNRSLVSPDNASYLLYDNFPTLPGYRTTTLEDGKGTDVGAMMCHHLFFPAMQWDAVFRDGELPLWNRYTMGGLPALGQGQTMFGEVLNLIPTFARSAAWSWDLKFIVARWLYAFGLGVAVWLITRHLASAGIIALSGAFVGFFAYKMNHALQFSVDLSPWILVAWLVLRMATLRRQLALAALALVGANWEVFTSGTIKEASMLMVCLNLAGVLVILLDRAAWRMRLVRLGTAAAAGLFFVLVTAPLWWTFLASLAVSTSSYVQAYAVQTPLRMFGGFFEDLLYRQHMNAEAHMLPSANFVVLAGVVWAIVRFRDLFAHRAVFALTLVALVPLAMAFGIIPAAWIVKVPFVANIHHINGTFSCVLLVLTSVIAGCGLHALARRMGRPGWRMDLLWLVVGVGILLGPCLFASRDRTFSPFFRFYLPALGLALVGAHCAIGAWHRRRDLGVFVVGVAFALVILLWRHGMYRHTPFDPYVLNPKVRADFRAYSPAVDFVSARLTEPSRPNGIRYNLFSGYGTMYGWESVYGVDPLRNQHFDQLARAGRVMKLFWCLDVPRSDQWFEEDTRTLQPMLDMLGVRYYLASPGTSPARTGGLTHLASLDLEVYESPSVWPRAFFCDRLETYDTVDALAARINDPAGSRPFAAIATADLPTVSVPAAPPKGDLARTIRPARDYRLTTNTTEFAVETTGPGVIVLHENDSPGGFRAYLDGQRVPYFRVNHTFKGIQVTGAGTHVVRFEYWPRGLTLALVVAASGYAIGISAFVWIWRSGRRKSVTGSESQPSGSFSQVALQSNHNR